MSRPRSERKISLKNREIVWNTKEVLKGSGKGYVAEPLNGSISIVALWNVTVPSEMQPHFPVPSAGSKILQLIAQETALHNT